MGAHRQGANPARCRRFEVTARPQEPAISATTRCIVLTAMAGVALALNGFATLSETEYRTADWGQLDREQNRLRSQLGQMQLSVPRY